MGKIEEILETDQKPKEKVSQITKYIKKENSNISELIDLLKNGTDVKKGGMKWSIKI